MTVLELIFVLLELFKNYNIRNIRLMQTEYVEIVLLIDRKTSYVSFDNPSDFLILNN